MSIFSIFKRKKDDNKKELTCFNNMCFVEPRTNKPFLSIIPNSICDGRKLKKIGSATKVNMFLQQLPLVANMAQSKAMEGAYKIVLPEGAIGKLMEYKNGMLSTTLIGENKKITGHAGLVPLDASKALKPVMIFSAMSAVTGQYFMARIDKTLSVISRDVKEIIDLIYDEKEADMCSIYDYYEYVKKNMNIIIENEALKIASLTNIQSNNSKLNSNIKFYTKSIKRKLNQLSKVNKEDFFTSARLESAKNLNDEIDKIVNQQSLCYELFCIGKMMEARIAEVYDDEYYDNIKDEFKSLNEEIDSNVDSLNECYEKVLSEMKEKAIIHEDKVADQLLTSNNYFIERKKILNDNMSNLINGVDMFLFESRKEKEFYVIEDGLYAKIEE